MNNVKNENIKKYIQNLNNEELEKFKEITYKHISVAKENGVERTDLLERIDQILNEQQERL